MVCFVPDVKSGQAVPPTNGGAFPFISYAQKCIVIASGAKQPV